MSEKKKIKKMVLGNLQEDSVPIWKAESPAYPDHTE
jgi:hypothetical protein